MAHSTGGVGVARALAHKNIQIDASTAIALSRAGVDFVALLSMDLTDVLGVPGIGVGRLARLKIAMNHAGWAGWGGGFHALTPVQRQRFDYYLRRCGKPGFDW